MAAPNKKRKAIELHSEPSMSKDNELSQEFKDIDDIVASQMFEAV
jgi:hypothetical protein